MKCIVLLSGGLDSAVNLAYALTESEVKLALTIDYGQQAATREIEAAQRLSNYYHVPLRILTLPWLADITPSALTNAAVSIPEPVQKDLDNLTITKETAKTVWVPNRNGLFINIAACFAESLQCDSLITGFNREEAATFSDNSPEFTEAATKSLYYSTSNQVKVLSYTNRMNKKDIVTLGQRLNLPWDLIWSCYRGGDAMCGKCESCQRMIRAFNDSNVQLPKALKF